MTLSDIRQRLALHGIRLTRSLGQNFLHDANQVRRILGLAEIQPGDRVLEIGPGLGALTTPLLNAGAEVVAVEKDRRLAAVLRDELGERPQCRLIEADALEWLRAQPADWADWKCVSNLPYSVGSPLLVELAQAEHGPERLVVTVQLEVARRLLANPGSKDYGILTLLVRLGYAPDTWFRIPAPCFFPPPAVDSACVRLKRRPVGSIDTECRSTFVQVVKQSFAQRRKMMVNGLRAVWPPELLATAFQAAGIPQHARAEEVSLEQFIELSRRLLSAQPPAVQPGARPFS